MIAIHRRLRGAADGIGVRQAELADNGDQWILAVSAEAVAVVAVVVEDFVVVAAVGEAVEPKDADEEKIHQRIALELVRKVEALAAVAVVAGWLSEGADNYP